MYGSEKKSKEVKSLYNVCLLQEIESKNFLKLIEEEFNEGFHKWNK